MGQYLSNKALREYIRLKGKGHKAYIPFFEFTNNIWVELLSTWRYSCILTLEDNCRHLFQITFRRIILFIPVIQGPRTKYTLSMKELIMDVSRLDIEVLLYGTVCRIVWRKLSHCSCLKKNWNVCSAEIYWLHIVEHI